MRYRGNAEITIDVSFEFDIDDEQAENESSVEELARAAAEDKVFASDGEITQIDIITLERV